ncbi:MAG: SlyX family protein [Gammaproteobacteria bacterium]|nr:SlyX family protein [Gammaproteobacteria bacterium]
MSDLLSERVTELEIKLAHQELTIDELNQITIQQQAEIQVLKEYVKIVNHKLNTFEEQFGSKKENELPPHY